MRGRQGLFNMVEQSRTRDPKVEWKNGEFRVSLPLEGQERILAKWRPTVTSVVRIREVGSERWSPGFETPLNVCGFAGLKPDTEYEVEVRYKTAAAEGPPASMRCRSNREGRVDNAMDRTDPSGLRTDALSS